MSYDVTGPISVLSKDSFSIFTSFQYPGGFLFGDGEGVGIQFENKPSQQIIDNYREMLGWVWVDTPDGILVDDDVQENGD